LHEILLIEEDISTAASLVDELEIDEEDDLEDFEDRGD
jgi:hypothetical protein